jgi:hypothetical protein
LESWERGGICERFANGLKTLCSFTDTEEPELLDLLWSDHATVLTWLEMREFGYDCDALFDAHLDGQFFLKD